MKNIIISFILATNMVACTPSAPEDGANTNAEEKAAVAVAFVDEHDSCKDVKYLFDALPKLEAYQGYNLEGVACFGHSISAEYKNPKVEHSKLQVFLHEEAGENKQTFNMSKVMFDMAKISKVNGIDISDLTIFNNAAMSIKKGVDYDDVAYMATYKQNYSLNMSLRGKDLGNKLAVDAFIKPYIDGFNLAKLP
ncbi:MAG: hypothetical protein ABL920_09745 [Methylotenera sp.]